MNLQTLSIILIIIIVPITLVLSEYINIQINTLSLQTVYQTQLKNATYSGIVAFQLNTVKNEYSTVSDSMRRDVSAAIQAFMTSLASNMGMGGASEATIKPYIPAVVFTLYDGYYIYAPALNTVDEKEAYEHVLKPYIYYSARYVHGADTDVIVNYTLDNYVVITGKVEGKEVTKSGYLIYDNKEIDENEVLEKSLPVTTIIYKDAENKNEVENVAVYDVELADVYVTSELMNENYSSRLTNGKYINRQRTNLEDNTEAGGIFKKVESQQLSILDLKRSDDLNTNQIDLNTIYDSVPKINLTLEMIQAKANLMGNSKFYNSSTGIISNEAKGEYNVGFYIEPSTDTYYINPESAKKYYENKDDNDENLTFTEWVSKHLGNIDARDAIDPNKIVKIEENEEEEEKKAPYMGYDEFKNNYTKIFNINSQNDPEKEDSVFNDHKRDIIKISIQKNLSQAIESYNANSEALGTTSSFQMPILSETEWDEVIRNVSMITFMQGIQVGTKIFNDYCIVTSTKNKEYISPDSIYYIPTNDNSEGYGYYHKINCSKLGSGDKIIGYKNSEFDRKSYEEKAYNSSNGKYEDKTYYYYMHPEQACYYCIVNASSEVDNKWQEKANKLRAYYTALAREKYNFYKTNSYFNQSN